MNILPTQPDPEKEGSFCSRKNLIQGNRHKPDLNKLMAFGTAATCYIPPAQRIGGKEPGQRKSFHGVIVGYEDKMPAYRVWDIKGRVLFLQFYDLPRGLLSLPRQRELAC
jgi:hypothetical protein